MSQNMVNKHTENAEKMGGNPLKEFPPTFELFSHCFLRLHQLKLSISTGLTFRKISKTPCNPEYGKVRWMDMSFEKGLAMSRIIAYFGTNVQKKEDLSVQNKSRNLGQKRGRWGLCWCGSAELKSVLLKCWLSLIGLLL